MELTKETVLKQIKEKELIKNQLEVSYNQIIGQIALLKDFLKKIESESQEKIST